MRVLVISNLYPPHHYGGYELSCRDVVDRWRQRGHEVTVLTTTNRVPGIDIVDPPHVHRDLACYLDGYTLVSPPVRRRLTLERRNQRVLTKLLADTSPDVVSVWNMGAMSLGLLETIRRRRLPVVYAICDDWLIFGPHLDAWTRLFVDRPLAGAAAALITGIPARLGDLGSTGTFCFVSETTRGRAERSSGWRFPRTAVVYSGIDRADFPPVGDDAREWGWRLLYVGRIDESKGIGTLIEALADLPEARLTVLGRGDEDHRRALVQRATALGVSDRLHWGSVPRETLREHYRNADAVIFPSVYDEPFGLVPVEAMACATPVVATGTGGSAEYLRDGENALLYPAGDARALALAVRRLAGDAVLRRRLVDGGLRLADELDVDRLADTLEAWLGAAVSGFTAGEPPARTLR